MENNLVSIIMPVYNNAKYLSESIESILKQSYENIELLILNDGSSDGSLAIIEKYAMNYKNIRLISWDNKGVASSIDELLKYANGEYIGRMDGDDLSYPDRIKTQVKYLRENRDVDLVGTFVDVDLIDYKNEDDRLLCEKIFNFKIDNKNLSIKILNGYKVCHGTFLARVNLFKKVKYNLDLKNSEDIDFIFNLIKQGYKIDIIPKKLYLNRVNSKFVHEQKYLNDDYNKEILLSKIKFLEDKILDRNICIIGKSKYSNQLYELLNRNKVRVKNVINKIGCENDLKTLLDQYIFILDKFESENIENGLKRLGKKNLDDFVIL